VYPRPRHAPTDTPRHARTYTPRHAPTDTPCPLQYGYTVLDDRLKAVLRQHGAKHSLFYAVEEKMLELVEDLIKEGADVNYKNHVSLHRVLSASVCIDGYVYVCVGLGLCVCVLFMCVCVCVRVCIYSVCACVYFSLSLSHSLSLSVNRTRRPPLRWLPWADTFP
jgi:hypothetical protein